MAPHMAEAAATATVRPTVGPVCRAARAAFRQQFRVSAGRVLKELARVAFSDVLDVLGEEDDAHRGVAAADLVRGLDPLVGVRRRHADVDDRDVLKGELARAYPHKNERAIAAWAGIFIRFVTLHCFRIPVFCLFFNWNHTIERSFFSYTYAAIRLRKCKYCRILFTCHCHQLIRLVCSIIISAVIHYVV